MPWNKFTLCFSLGVHSAHLPIASSSTNQATTCICQLTCFFMHTCRANFFVTCGLYYGLAVPSLWLLKQNPAQMMLKLLGEKSSPGFSPRFLRLGILLARLSHPVLVLMFYCIFTFSPQTHVVRGTGVLQQYVDSQQLPKQVDGDFSHSHSDWLAFRLVKNPASLCVGDICSISTEED